MSNAINAYPYVKTIHILSVVLSLSLFVARWLGVLVSKKWPMLRRIRLLSIGIDIVLLSAGAALWTMGGWHPWHTPWLGVKLLMLVVYVLLGSWALKRSQSRTGHLFFGLAALTVAAQMVGVALHHDATGWLAR